MAADFIIPNGTDYLRKPRETSPLISLREPTATNQLWKMIQQTGKRVSSMTNLLQQLNGRIARAERWGTVPATTEYFPFKVYQPNLLNLPPFGVIFDQYGNPTRINISSSVPTSFTSIPPTVNPTTDGWRFLAVRNGVVQINSIYTLPSNFNISNAGGPLFDVFDFATQQTAGADSYLSGVDGIGSSTAYASIGNIGTIVPTPNAYDAQTTTPLFYPNQSTWGSVLVIDGAAPPTNGYCIWLNVINQANQSTTVGHITVRASSSGIFPNANTYVGYNANVGVVPLAVVRGIKTNGTIGSIQQLAYNHLIGDDFGIKTRYTNSSLQPYMVNSQMNYVGNWQTDTGSPINIQTRTFQPGDCITYTVPSLSISKLYTVQPPQSPSEAVTITLNYSMQYLLMMTATGTATNPIVDSRWVQVASGMVSPSFS